MTVAVSVRVDPFPGLRSFEPDEDHLFFGRETHVDELLGRLRRTRFLAVVGGSGSGKSSLVKSGLIPSLYGGSMLQAGSSWRVALLRPGADPILGLASALNHPDVLGGDPATADLTGALLEATLRRSSQALVEAVRQHRLPDGDNVLVIVDQFEELFRFKQARATADGRDEAVAFVKLLLEAARQDAVPIYVVLTMRSEFIGSCAEFPGLPEAVNDGQYLVPRLTRDQLRLAITGPIAVAGGAIAPRLVTRLLNEVGDDPDQLPVLQHALMRTWDHWSSHGAGGRPIDVADYEAIGTMTGALSRHADDAYAEIAIGRGRDVAALVFKALTETTGQALGLRRPCRVRELCAIADASIEEIAAAIDRFRIAGRSFLVPSSGTPLDPQTIVDLSHESLMRLWDRLVAWTHEEARSAEIYRRLGGAALLHARGEAGLWRDPELQLTVNWRDTQHPTAAWAHRYDPEFERASAFLADSIEARDAEASMRRAAAAERQLQERKIRRRTRAVFAVSLLGALVVLFSVNKSRQIKSLAAQTLIDANRQMALARQSVQEADQNVEAARGQMDAAAMVVRDKESQIQEADGRVAAAMRDVRVQTNKANASLLATTIAEEFHEASHPEAIGQIGLLAIEALRLDPSSPLARHTLMDAMQLLPPQPLRPIGQGHTAAVTRMVTDPDGRVMATYAEDRRIVVWDFGGREARRTIAENVAAVRDLAISGDGQWLAAATADAVDIWEIATGRAVNRLGFPAASVALSPDHARLSVIDASGAYTRYATADWHEEARGKTTGFRNVLFSPTGVEILESSLGLRRGVDGADAPATANCGLAQFDAAGAIVAKCRNELVQFDLTPDSLVRRRVLAAPAGASQYWLNAADEHGEHQFVITRSRFGVSVFQSDGNEYLRIPRKVTQLTAPRAGQWIATGEDDGTVLFWHLVHGMAQALPYKADVSDLTFSHDERMLAVAEGRDRVVVIETAAPHRTFDVPLPGSTELRNPQFSPDDSLFAVLEPKALHLFRTSDWKLLTDRTITPAHEGDEMSIFFSGGRGDLVVVAGARVRRFRLSPWTELPPFDASLTPAYVSKDRRWIAFGDSSATASAARLLDVDAGTLVAPSRVPFLRDVDAEHQTAADLVRALRNSPDWARLPDKGNRLAGDTDGGEWWQLDTATIQTPIVDIKEKLSGHRVAGLVHESNVHAISISREGNWIATASDDRQVFLWPWNQKGLIDLTCTLVPRNLTREEWKDLNLDARGLGPHRLTCPPRPAVQSAAAVGR